MLPLPAIRPLRPPTRARGVRLGHVMRPRTPPKAFLAATPPPACLTRAGGVVHHTLPALPPPPLARIESPLWRFYAPLATRIALPRLALGALHRSAAAIG
ncbi:uncharacterized protein SCHCODRAFT_02733378 [Schizophyllum commune H4-8]|uniref:uncharacterized protein n=1 Tax=Schizophyllum commune (strain H4-8 / FGSC 9210) TaxID=578458 RepID=UPI0021601AC3|nr:uncharacterized protein SCHCODRAFT_02733378 [Schizophyllum commune H4-8]KAI5892566.1 hypothetical protein SCHCODRAFT_02733378 [Schizophyllum commune H4-8]